MRKSGYSLTTWQIISSVYNTHHEQPGCYDKAEKDGWILHHVKGDHHQFKHPTRSGKVTIPHPHKDIPNGTLRNIYRQAGWEWSEK
jgi:predicted RNA binding protein YcfA (HicA-like mRNA interferase family)